MKYRQLTKEQLENLATEFAQFLATQSIDVKEWDSIKKHKPKVAEEELNIFSDIVWDDVLSKTKYVEHFSKKTLNLFKFSENKIDRIAIHITWDINLQTQKGLSWLLKNPLDNSVEIFKGTKSYSISRNEEIFDLIEKGGTIANKDIYEYFASLT